MRRSLLLMCALSVTATSGCDRARKQAATIGATIVASIRAKIELARQRFLHKPPPPAPVEAPPPLPAPAPAPAAPTAPPAAAARHPAGPAAAHPAKPRPAAEPPQQPAVALSPRGLRDEPYVSQDTGTVVPGMSEKDVYSLWGRPAAVRTRGDFTYLYFKNGCEYSCGHLDVVTLRHGQVVDAIVRWPGHGYSGESSSPASVVPHGPPPGGDTLRVRRDPT